MKIDELVEKYIKIRDKLSKLKAEYEAEAAKYKAVQEKIEALMLRQFNELGVDSMKTASGTAYVSIQTRASIADWDSFRQFLDTQEDPYMYVERRVSKAAVEQYKAAHDDLPPGVSWSETRGINFRRS